MLQPVFGTLSRIQETFKESKRKMEGGERGRERKEKRETHPQIKKLNEKEEINEGEREREWKGRGEHTFWTKEDEQWNRFQGFLSWSLLQVVHHYRRTPQSEPPTKLSGHITCEKF